MGREPERLLIGAREVCRLLGVGMSTLDRRVATGDIPGPVRIGRMRERRWRLDELRAWIDAGCRRVDGGR